MEIIFYSKYVIVYLSNVYQFVHFIDARNLYVSVTYVFFKMTEFFLQSVCVKTTRLQIRKEIEVIEFKRA